MGLSNADKILIKALREKNYGSKKIVKMFPHRNWRISTVSYFLKHLNLTNGSLAMKPGRGRKRTGRSQVNIEQVRQIFQNAEPTTSLSSRKVARITRIKRGSVRNIIKNDLNLRPFKKVYCQKLTLDVKNKRFERCQILLRRFRTREQIRKIWFSDEKLFSLRQPKNSQNNRVYSDVRLKRQIPLASLLVPRQHFAESVMVSLAVSMLGKSSIIFVNSGVKINSEVYQSDILATMLPEIEAISDDYTFQQDGAPSHTSRTTIRYLQENCPDFIEPRCWPPNSPDLNPVDYTIWSRLEAMVHEDNIFRNTEELKQRILYCWEQFHQVIVDNAIGQWRRRLQAVVNNEGGHIHNEFL